ncbi:holo-[acyl-carrier protein] synthase [Entomoplasma freundtii]|uniref:Holo-[acyl-carrier-protein] synthase n=1 Tax=Entomoplasma freundtii TaxID=74700 RepID=A0A2K8NRN0_9MOLU|nr:4'-phosphopantetheinyl transferase superfamily protein [Entomoplasma freundtii]ATZ16490.1 holo-[acyl-carrier-protein] synthase [Entomoplasma freundtii]TDY56019.1 holo-[acyl-carrier protein] synthase [Entomoplasma freundtii]
MNPRVGIDILEISRLDLKPVFLERILTLHELEEYQKFEDLGRKKEFCAGRWAAKEAIYKVLDEKERLPFSQLEIGYRNDRPIILTSPFESIAISISHEKHYSVAIALRWQ